MTATLNDVPKRIKQEPTAEQLAAQEMVARAREQGLSLTGPEGLLKQLTKTVLETALNQELTEHLGHDKHGAAQSGNVRNGTRPKTVLTEASGQVQIDVPRDRAGTFEPQIVRKRQRRLTGVDEIVLSLYARGLTTGEISAHFEEIYGASVSKETISRITGKVIEEMQSWQARPLDPVYAAIFVDAIVVKVRDGQVANRPVYAAIGLVQQEFFRPAGDATVWVDEMPEWAVLSPVGYVTGYWRWRGAVPGHAPGRAAAWGYRAGFGGHGEYGVLGARFEPHEYSYLRVCVGATLELQDGLGSDRFRHARVGLPLEYVGGVLAGAFHEPDLAGPGTLTFDHAAVHDADSSYEAFRLLAMGVVRLLGLPAGGRVPADLLPRFGGSAPAAPGSG
jgi:hypothetical protein